MPAFTRFAWTVLGVNLAVVLWGAVVRATGSGAGCGRHWPTCNGQVVPRAPATETLIEFVHRSTSGIALLLVAVLVAWAVRSFPRGHAARKAAWVSLALMLTEALVGAGLVLFGWVAKDASPERGWVIAVHLTNTFLLLGALALTAEWSARPGGLEVARRGALAGALAAALGMVLLAAVTGAIAALGDALFPATSFVQGFRDEAATGARVLLRLRLLHPFAALAAGAALVAVTRIALRERPEDRVRRLAMVVVGLVASEIAIGLANVLLLAPVFLQIIHLLVADALWLTLVLLAAATLARGGVPVRRDAAVAATA